jgi:outer membrane lipoprotein SlyB
MSRLPLAAAFAAGLAFNVAALAQTPSTMTPGSAQPAGACTTCGTVTSIKYVEEKGQGSGVGAVAGAVVGGVVGHQFGSGRGNTVATIAGAGLGAVGGNAVEKQVKKKTYYSVTLRMDGGNTRTLTQSAKPAFHEGDRVKIVDGNRLALIAN